jgi:hypothetical protein
MSNLIENVLNICIVYCSRNLIDCVIVDFLKFMQYCCEFFFWFGFEHFWFV